MGSGDSVVRATVGSAYNPEDPHADFPITLTPETYQYVRTESTIAVALSADGTTTGLTTGATREVTGKVTYSSWEVWQSNYGNSENRALSNGVAIDATVSYSVESGGDGTVSPHLDSNNNHRTNTNGDAKAAFTMGSQESVVRMDVSYAGATAYGTLAFSPESIWVHTGDDHDVRVTLTENNGVLKATVNAATWEIWTRGTETQNRNYKNGPAGNAQVTLSFTQGDGSFTSSSGSTDTLGEFHSEYYTSGDGLWMIQADVIFNDRTGSDELSVAARPPPPPDCSCIYTACPRATCTCGGSGSCDDQQVVLCTCNGNGCPSKEVPARACGSFENGTCSTCCCNRSGCNGTSCMTKGGGCECYEETSCPGCTNQPTDGNPEGTCPGMGCSCSGTGGCGQQAESFTLVLMGGGPQYRVLSTDYVAVWLGVTIDTGKAGNQRCTTPDVTCTEQTSSANNSVLDRGPPVKENMGFGAERIIGSISAFTPSIEFTINNFDPDGAGPKMPRNVEISINVGTKKYSISNEENVRLEDKWHFQKISIEGNINIDKVNP